MLLRAVERPLIDQMVPEALVREALAELLKLIEEEL